MKYILAIALIIVTPSAVFADDSLATARDLYASAAYEDALAMLGRLNTTGLRNDDGRVADQYRALSRGEISERRVRRPRALRDQRLDDLRIDDRPALRDLPDGPE